MVIKRNQNSIFYRNIARRNRNQLVTKLKFLFPIETKLEKESLRRNEVKVFCRKYRWGKFRGRLLRSKRMFVIGETRLKFLFFPRAIEFVWFEKKWPWPFFPPPPISHHLLTDRAVDLSTGCVVHRFILASLERNHSRSFLLGARRSTKYSSCAFFPTNCQQNRPPSRAAVLRYRGYRLWELKYSKGRDQV